MNSTSTIQLAEIAHTRSGDKGNHSNIGVIAHTPEGYEFLLRELTPQRLRVFFQSLEGTRVERFELPRLRALNFMLYDVLGGGASRSLRLDTQGKLLGTAILELKLPRPENLSKMLRTPPD